MAEVQTEAVVAFHKKDILTILVAAGILFGGSQYIDSKVQPVELKAEEAHEHAKRVESRFDTFLAQDAEHEKACAEDKGRMKKDIEELKGLLDRLIRERLKHNTQFHNLKGDAYNVGLYAFGGFSQPLSPSTAYYDALAGKYGLGFDYALTENLEADVRFIHKSLLGEDNCGINDCYGDNSIDGELRYYFK